jgi:hypothetical protein
MVYAASSPSELHHIPFTLLGLTSGKSQQVPFEPISSKICSSIVVGLVYRLVVNSSSTSY